MQYINFFKKTGFIFLSALFSISSLAALYHCPAIGTIQKQCIDPVHQTGCRSWVSKDGLSDGVLWQGYTLDNTGSDKTKITSFVAAAWHNYFQSSTQGIMYCWYRGTDNAIIRFAPQSFSEKAQAPIGSDMWQLETINNPPLAITGYVCTLGSACRLRSAN